MKKIAYARINVSICTVFELIYRVLLRIFGKMWYRNRTLQYTLNSDLSIEAACFEQHQTTTTIAKNQFIRKSMWTIIKILHKLVASNGLSQTHSHTSTHTEKRISTISSKSISKSLIVRWSHHSHSNCAHCWRSCFHFVCLICCEQQQKQKKTRMWEWWLVI